MRTSLLPFPSAISENYEFNVVHHKCLFMGKKVSQATLYLSAAASILSYRITITVKPIFHFRFFWSIHKNVVFSQVDFLDKKLSFGTVVVLITLRKKDFRKPVTLVHIVWKLLKNDAYEFFTNFCPIKSTCLMVTMFDHKLQFFETSANWLFLPFLINFCPLNMKA